ncbi:MAG: Uma2 family endonuclease [Actinomycetota bacterium]
MALAHPDTRRYTYADLAGFPADRLRREIIDGELIVTASPVVRHQMVSSNIHHFLFAYATGRGGLVLAAPMDVVLSEDNVVEPDLLFVAGDPADQADKSYIGQAPDLVVEISSPSTRRLELVRKRELYQRYRVPEYWYVDLEADRVEVYVLSGDAYPAPEMLYPGQTLQSSRLAGFVMPLDEVLALDPPIRMRRNRVTEDD